MEEASARQTKANRTDGVTLDATRGRKTRADDLVTLETVRRTTYSTCSYWEAACDICDWSVHAAKRDELLSMFSRSCLH